MNTSNRIERRTPPSHWLDIVETFAVVTTIGGTIAAAVSQQIVMAAIPLSLTATLNLANRRRQMGALLDNQRLEITHLMVQGNNSLQAELSKVGQMSDAQQTQIDHLTEQDAQNIQSLETLTSKTTKLNGKIDALNQLQDQSQSSLDSLNEQQQSTVTQGDELSSQMADLENAIALLQSTTSELSHQVEAQQHHSQSLASQTENVEELLEVLREIDAITQAISAKPNVAESFYQRGLVRKRLKRIEDQQIVLKDFSQAIQLEPTHAGAYFERGVLQSELAHKQGAVDDLNAAAKLYFEAGQLDQYEQARDLSQTLHDLVDSSSINDETAEPILVENLFS